MNFPTISAGHPTFGKSLKIKPITKKSQTFQILTRHIRLHFPKNSLHLELGKAVKQILKTCHAAGIAQPQQLSPYFEITPKIHFCFK